MCQRSDTANGTIAILRRNITTNGSVRGTSCLIDFWRNGVNERDGALKSFDFRASPMKVRSPVPVLGGEEDTACPIQDQRDIFSFLPPALAAYLAFANCGHGMYFDHPEETESAIRQFLAE